MGTGHGGGAVPIGEDDLQAWVDGRLPPGFGIPSPSDDPALREDEDPLGDDLFAEAAEEAANRAEDPLDPGEDPSVAGEEPLDPGDEPPLPRNTRA